MTKGNSFMLTAVVLLMLGSGAFVQAATYRGMDNCLGCHTGRQYERYLDTLHPYKVQGPPTETETPVLSTTIDEEKVSIFDPRTTGYDTYIAPWADYFNEDNVAYTIGGAGWKQHFMTQVIPQTVDGQTYSGKTHLAGNDYVVMGMMWNIQKQQWQDYHGPLGPNNWYTEDRLTRKKCGGCHTTGFKPNTGTWADQNSDRMAKGVSCESCHGPDYRETNPEYLTFKQRFELCGSCHGRGSSVADDGSPGPYGYPYSEALGRGFEPGDDLADFYIQSTSSSNFWPNGNSKKHHQQYNDSLLSKHTEAEVGCDDCHTSHNAGYAHQTKLPGNLLCVHCHSELADETAYRRHSAHSSGATKCIDCHMPYTAKSMNAFDIRSHTCNSIPPAETIAQGGDPAGFSGPLDTAHIPNSCNSKCHNGQGSGFEKTNSVAQIGYEYIRALNGSAIRGDLNHDDIVNLFDLGLFADDWGKEAE